ncbi:MAG: adenosylcobinamide-phosphate synthase CbiB [Verrucomicrobiales bacterium]|nr:adenosylcobinamide-phosphate synthase CbiB [Verrucomicrobiales bacterium]
MSEIFSTTPLQLALALLLDLILGDPRFFPHPAKWTGAMVLVLEKVLVKGLGRTVLAGGLLCGGIILFQVMVLAGLAWFLPSRWWWFVELWVIYQSFAAMDMQRHVRAILRPLRDGDLSQARLRLSWIVGRDTANLSEPEICRATVESVGESACDALIAPLFWAAVAGPLGALIYRVSNTLDSMVGHRGERYGKLGKISARWDDVLNWIPARLLAFLSSPYRWFTIAREAREHRSPNAGWGESAVAWVVGVRLGGENHYAGQQLHGPVFNPQGRQADQRAIVASLYWWWRMVITGILLMIALCYLR